MIFSSLASFPASTPFKSYLSDFKSFFAESKNLNEKFVQHCSTILFQLNQLFVDLQERSNQIELFINENGIHYLIRFMKILEQLFQYPICAANIPVVHDNSHGNKLSNGQLKQIEQCLLACLDYLIQQSKNSVSIVAQNADNLWSIALFLTSSNIQCRIFVLKIFTKISSFGTNNTGKILDIFTTLSIALREDYRFKFLIDMLNLSGEFCSSNGKVELAVVDLLVEILNNVKPTDKNSVLTEMEDAGFNLERFEMRLNSANVSRANLIWNKIEQLRFIQSNSTSNNLHSDCYVKVHHNGKQDEFAGQMKELNLAFKKLEHEKRILVLLENELKEKYDILMTNIHNMKIKKTINADLCSNDSNKLKMAETDKRSLYDFNVKSCEEEIVRHSVVYSANDFPHCKFNNCNSNYKNVAYNNNSTSNGNKIINSNHNNLKKKKLLIGNRSSMDLGANYVDNFKTNKYFSYIMSNVNNLDVTFNPRSRSIRKSLSQIFGRSHPKENKTNCATNSGLNGSVNSLIIADNNLDERDQLTSMSESGIASQHIIHQYDTIVGEINNVDYGEESIKSLSLPNAFRSNFILRKNSEIYLPQLETSNDFDSI